MRKIIAIVCIFVTLILALCPVATARPTGGDAQGDGTLEAFPQPDIAPRPGKIESAIAWAQSLIGQTSFPLTDGLDCTSYYMCSIFVSNAYGCPAPFGGDAYGLWYISRQHPGDWDAPRGSLVFFGPNEGNSHLGHVALCIGDGSLIEAGYPYILLSTIEAENRSAKYLGWAWPQPDWPGRNDRQKGIPTAAIIGVSAAVLVLGAGADLRIIRKKGKSAKGMGQQN